MTTEVDSLLDGEEVNGNTKTEQVEKPTEEKCTQYHPCSWCGGFKRTVAKTAVESGAEKEVVVALKLQPPKNAYQANKGPMLVCNRCMYRVFNDRLGRAEYYGVEMNRVRGEVRNEGFFPVTK